MSALDRIGQVGAWLGPVRLASAATMREAASTVEALGYGSFWVSDTPTTRDPFSASAVVLAATSSLVVGTGIANVWGRDAAAMNGASQALAEAYPSRFVLGLGVSHSPDVARRGHAYVSPVAKMRSYLDELDASPYDPPAPAVAAPRMLAALGPRMLELSRDRTAGALPYLTTPEHTKLARDLLGPGSALIPEQTLVLESSPSAAREAGREFLTHYLAMPNYQNNLLRMGFTYEDLSGGGSDRLVDALVAWRSVETVAERIRDHLAAGADHVALQPLPRPGDPLGLEQLRLLAPLLVG
ncbi:TIGR03620 family F420-dependent LLM class oxidoreductase [Tenggerimyces flavus]|uniref:TIGR03620 family F420-dependent LLM class oxidoreductase n=1 Tax=Tenggerimyces flavus TaxID=1708749 RepID=A0ABV7YI53_9ACTN|nr:TIGR03620 family F420-dependent LLM class oxidoreductase [Tenggerimyces flavus]MBM7786831.1 putative F420-dependent oxidoreductase [Tenggerimyces flavus]